MAIYIGTGAPTTFTGNTERISLYSQTQPDMVILKSPLSNVNILFDYNMTFGRSNQTFAFQQNGSSLFTISSNANISYKPTYIQNSLAVKSPATFNSNIIGYTSLSVPIISTSNIQITAAGALYYLNVVNQNGGKILQSSSNGDTYLYGNYYVSQDGRYNGQLDVIGDFSAKTITADTWYNTASLHQSQAPNTIIPRISLSNQIKQIYLFGETTVDNTLHVSGDLDVHGKFILNDVQAQTIRSFVTLTAPEITLSNNAFPRYPTATIIHDSRFLSSNVINVSITTNKSSSPTFSALVMDSTGAISIGPHSYPRSNSAAIVDIQYDNYYGISNILKCTGSNPWNITMIDKYGNIGIGTNSSIHHLQIIHTEENQLNSNAFVGIYNKSSSNTAPFITAYASNYIPVFQVANQGQTTIGNLVADSNWMLSVANNMQVPLIQTSTLIAPPSSCNISLNWSSLCNVAQYYGSNMVIANSFVASTLVTNYFKAGNVTILGLDINNDLGYFNISTPKLWFSGLTTVFSTNANDLDSYDGQLKINTPQQSDLTITSVGVNVIGNTKNSIRVTSKIMPTIEVFRQDSMNNITNQGYIGIDSYGFMALSYKDINLSQKTSLITLASVNVGSQGYQGILLLGGGNYMVATNDGRMGIRLGSTEQVPILPSHNLEVAGSVLFKTEVTQSSPISTPVLCTLGSSVGIGTDTPGATYALDVNGNANFNNNTSLNNTNIQGQVSIGIGTNPPIYPYQNNAAAYFTSNVYFAQNIGIGTNQYDPNYMATISGSLNVDKLYVDGVQINSSSSLTQNLTGQFTLNNSLGIQTNNPLATLDVQGSTLIHSSQYNYPAQALTSYSSNIANITYTVTSSSMCNLLHLFDKNTTPSPTFSWSSKDGYHPTDGSWIGTASSPTNSQLITNPSLLRDNQTFPANTFVDGKNVGGHWIQLNTSIPLYYNSVNIAANPTSGPGNPYSIIFAGSFDNANWTQIGRAINPNWSTNASRYNTFNIQTTTAYNYTRLIFTSIFPNRDPTKPGVSNVSVAEIYFQYNTSGGLYMNNSTIGIGTTVGRQSIDIVNGNIVVNNGNIGIGTLIPTMPLYVNGAVYMSGTVGIAKTQPKSTFALDIGGNLNFDGSLYQSGNIYISSQWTTDNNATVPSIYTTSNVCIGMNSSQFSQYSLYTQNPAYFNSNVTVNATLFTRGSIASTSDRAVKTNITPLCDSLVKVQKLSGYKYTRIDTKRIEYGLIAQEVAEVFPELIQKSDDNLLTISYGNMAAIFVDAINTLNKKVATLEAALALKDTI